MLLSAGAPTFGGGGSFETLDFSLPSYDQATSGASGAELTKSSDDSDAAANAARRAEEKEAQKQADAEAKAAAKEAKEAAAAEKAAAKEAAAKEAADKAAAKEAKEKAKAERQVCDYFALETNMFVWWSVAHYMICPGCRKREAAVGSGTPKGREGGGGIGVVSGRCAQRYQGSRHSLGVGHQGGSAGHQDSRLPGPGHQDSGLQGPILLDA